MKLRSDSASIAGWKRAHDLRGCPGDDPEHVAHDPAYAGIPAAEIGDAWFNPGWQGLPDLAGGYTLTCPSPACLEGVHRWWHAFDCPAGSSPREVCKRGALHRSCWEWSGSVDAGNLTATPSLHVLAERGGCGWHGWIRGGEMVPA